MNRKRFRPPEFGRFELALMRRLKQALDTTCTVMSADPAIDNAEEVAAQFQPEGILVDSDVRMGARTAFERLSAVRSWFPDLPMIVVGNIMFCVA